MVKTFDPETTSDRCISEWLAQLFYYRPTHNQSLKAEAIELADRLGNKWLGRGKNTVSVDEVRDWLLVYAPALDAVGAYLNALNALSRAADGDRTEFELRKSEAHKAEQQIRSHASTGVGKSPNYWRDWANSNLAELPPTPLNFADIEFPVLA